ncbi:MAG TPA: tetratricopeptide repeat protein [Methanoregulaceae archaeon]|nr:tetratricopeptide repeat protein [Methanoregulaceae archaeon]
MVSDAPERKRQAILLFKEGRYAESYEICAALPKDLCDPEIEVLAATSLYYTGRLDEAELHFRDLLRKMPESSHVHGFLGKVLAKKGEDSARKEFSIAVSLEPDNQDALRNYVRCLAATKDLRRSLPAQRRLLELSKREDDCRDLITSLVGLGEGREALGLFEEFPSLKSAPDPLYIDALSAAGEFTRAADLALEEYKQSGDPLFLIRYLRLLTRTDPARAMEEYGTCCRDGKEIGVLSDFLSLLVANERYREALTVCRKIGSIRDCPEIRLSECRILAALGERDQAMDCYFKVIECALGTTGTDEFLETSLDSFREFLMVHYPRKEAVTHFLSAISSNVNPVCLREAGRLFEQVGDSTEARAWFYRSYRSDYLSGGLGYAEFLGRSREWRECEKVMLYILSNVRKTQDIVRIAGVTSASPGMIHENRRLLSRLIERLGERREDLPANGLEFLAVSYLVAATNALGDGDYRECKRYCLKGLDVLPAYSSCIGTKDFIAVLDRCKQRAIVDPAVIDGGNARVGVPEPREPAPVLTGLDPGEEKVLEFLKLHRCVTEGDLRKLLGTRRVAGIVNRLMAKSSSQGVKLISRKGCGDQGEVYEYTGD